MKKYNGLFWLIGLCAFVAFMLSGIIWLIGLIGISWSLLSTLESVANIVLIVCTFLAGWVWLSSVKVNKKFKLVLQILFIIFAVLSICGVLM
ncbi:MAG: hypothetical protein ACI35S_08610 [Anaeroplasma sp.]